MSERYNALLWDLDGTIVDTKACHFFSWQKTLQKHGYSIDQAVFEENFGRKNTTLVPLFLGLDPGADLMGQIINEKETIFRRLAPKQAGLVPGVRSWLSTAEELNFTQVIASSAPIENIAIMLATFELENYFEIIISGTELPAKPEPEIFLKAAHAVGCHPKDCLVIEDSLAGIRAAKNAGMKCIAVTTTHPRVELTMADLVLDDFFRPLRDVLTSTNWI